MRLSIPSLQSTLAVVSGIIVTTTLLLAVEATIVAQNNGVATVQMMRLIWVMDVLVLMTGGYITARIAAHSPVKHSIALAGLFLPPVAVLGYASAEPPLQILITALAIAICILLGAIGRDWQQLRSRGYAA